MRLTKRIAMTMLGAWLGASAMAAQTSATVKDDLFNGTEIFAKGASDVTEVTMDPDTLGMVDGKDGNRAHSMVLNVVRTYSYDKPGMYNVQDVDAFRNKLNTGDWHCSVHTRSLKTGESTDVCNKRRTDDMVESAIITVSPKELTFIHTIRKRGSGWSDAGQGALYMPGVPGLPTLALISPLDQLRLNLQMHDLNQLDLQGMQQKLQNAMPNLNALDDKEIQRQMDKMQSDIKRTTDKEVQKELDAAQRSLKQLQDGGATDKPQPKQPQ